MNLQISAVICTLNRAQYLRKAIRSLVDQTLSRDQYEIVVVDNGSTDNTRQIVLEEFPEVRNLLYFYEPQQGLAVARNAGWNHARAEYVAYLDDDAIACPAWLQKIVETFETVRPKPGCVGGKVDLIWETPRPNWLPDEAVSYLAFVYWADTALFFG